MIKTSVICSKQKGGRYTKSPDFAFTALSRQTKGQTVDAPLPGRCPAIPPRETSIAKTPFEFFLFTFDLLANQKFLPFTFENSLF
ncbi:MAG TPA: hypothetical protein VL307_04910 [Chitinophagaceae bacterium]|nr:hypothetical protein [Chitinophagaceae bacterium]